MVVATIIDTTTNFLSCLQATFGPTGPIELDGHGPLDTTGRVRGVVQSSPREVLAVAAEGHAQDTSKAAVAAVGRMQFARVDRAKTFARIDIPMDYVAQEIAR